MTTETIAIRQDGDKHFAVQEWPERALMAINVLRQNPLVSVDEDGMIIIKVENGYAAYKLAVDQESEIYLTLELNDGSWSPLPSIDPIENK